MPERSNWSEDSDIHEDAQSHFDRPSWINKHNSTEGQNSATSGGSASASPLDREKLPSKLDRIIRDEHTAARRPLSVRGDVSLRSEAVHYESGEAHDWSTTVQMYRRWLDGYTGDDSGTLVLEDEDGNEFKKSANVRFGEHRAKKEYARLHNLHDGLEDEYDNLHIAMLSLTASSRNDRGGLRCPADHLHDVDSSRDAVMACLRRQLPNRRFQTAWVLEPHKSGYVHRHLVVFVEGAVPRSVFEPVIDSHLNNSEPARKPAHEYAECIDVKPVERDGDDAVNSIAYYLAEYISDSFEPTEDTPEHVERFNALLWATGKRRVGYSQGAYEYIERGYELHTGKTKTSSDSSGWSLVGFEDEDGEVHTFDPEDGNSVTMVSPESLAPRVLDPRGEPPPDDADEASAEGTETDL